jgi:hypothetical protein
VKTINHYVRYRNIECSLFQDGAEEQGYADICAAEPAGDQPAQTRQGAPLAMKRYLTASVGPLGYGSVLICTDPDPSINIRINYVFLFCFVTSQ